MSALSYASLSGTPILAASLVIPYLGIWHVDVTLTEVPPSPTTGAQVLVLADMTLTCSPVRVIDFAGRREVRLVGGQAGWRKLVPAKQYLSASGIPISTVLGDCATFVQEPPPVLDPTIPPTVGGAYCRQQGQASLVLQQLLGNSWWMDVTGVIQTMPRPKTPITSDFTAIDVRGASGQYVIATENPGDWTPGSTFVGPTINGTVNLVRHVLGGNLRTEIMVS